MKIHRDFILDRLRLIRVLKFFTDPGQRHNRQHPADTASGAVGQRLKESVLTLDHKNRRAKNGAVDGQQRQNRTEGVV